MNTKIKRVVLLVSIFLFSGLNCIAAPIGKIAVTVNDKQVSTATAPLYQNGTVFVPIREFAELMEYQVRWIESSNSVELIKMGDISKITLDSKVAEKNGKMVNLIIAPFLLNDITYVPIEVINKYLGFSASWDENNRCINIIPTESVLSRSLVADVLEKNTVIDIANSNLLDNGDFEDGIDGWGTKYKSVISEDYTNAHSGDGSIKIALSDGLAATQYNIKEVLSKNGTGTYLLEFWAKADINDAPLVIYCPKYDNAAGVNVYTSVKLNKEWTKYTVEKNLTWTDLGNPILIFGHDNQANKGFTFWLDDVVYTKK